MSNISQTTAQLKKFQKICVEAVYEFSANHPEQLSAPDTERLNGLLERMFNGELDFLHNNPDEYFELYEE